MSRRWQAANYLMAVLLMLATSHSALAWEQRSKTGDPVQLWTEQLAGEPFQRVRAETLVQAPLFRLLRLLQEAHTQREWLPYTHRVDILSQPAPGQTLVRFQSQARWPIAARDAITLFVVSQPDSNSLRIDMLNQPQTAPPTPGVQRIERAEGYWLLTAEADCATRVRYEAGNQWGGNVPQWLVNKVNRNVSVEALHNLRHWGPDQPRSNTPPDHLQTVPRHAFCD